MIKPHPGGAQTGSPKRGPYFWAPGKVGPKFGIQFWNQIWDQIWVQIRPKFGVQIVGGLLIRLWAAPGARGQGPARPRPGPRAQNLGPKSGPQIWGPKVWAPNLTQIWDPNLGPKFGPKLGTQIWAQIWSQNWAPNLGPTFLGTLFWAPLWGSLFGTLRGGFINHSRGLV